MVFFLPLFQDESSSVWDRNREPCNLSQENVEEACLNWVSCNLSIFRKGFGCDLWIYFTKSKKKISLRNLNRNETKSFKRRKLSQWDMKTENPAWMHMLHELWNHGEFFGNRQSNDGQKAFIRWKVNFVKLHPSSWPETISTDSNFLPQTYWVSATLMFFITLVVRLILKHIEIRYCKSFVIRARFWESFGFCIQTVPSKTNPSRNPEAVNKEQHLILILCTPEIFFMYNLWNLDSCWNESQKVLIRTQKIVNSKIRKKFWLCFDQTQFDFC